MAMLQIIEARVYLKYLTLRNKEIELRGIKDFLQSVYYGLGIKDLNDFTANVVKSAMKERSKNRYANQFIEWLRSQDKEFQFPPEYFEYRRIMRIIFYSKTMPKSKKMLAYKWTKFIYNTRPQLLYEIGWDRKYKTVESCYYGEGFEEKAKILKPIKSYRNPTDFQLDQLADSLHARLGHGKSKALALKLLQLCDNDDTSWEGDSGNDDAASPERS